jgi:hypothetical protein
MSQKESDNKEWTDPKDFGLPFVEINPIYQAKDSSSTDSSNSEPLADLSDEKPISATDGKSDELVKKKDEKSKRTVKEKNPTIWIWTVVLIAVVMAGVIIWQLQTENPIFPKPKQKEVSQNGALQVEKEIEQPIQTIQLDESQENGSKDSVATTTNSNSPISKDSETGTTIAKEYKAENLIRIDSKAEKVRYFVVVSSLPNEKLALEMAEKFSGKSAELYLILPYESNPNYRLAVSQFGSWKAASDEVARIKPQFSEDLWILNY